jgi:hypothetical protein
MVGAARPLITAALAAVEYRAGPDTAAALTEERHELPWGEVDAEVDDERMG